MFTTAPSARMLKSDSMARAQQRLPITFAKPRNFSSCHWHIWISSIAGLVVLSPVLTKWSSLWLTVELYWFTSMRTQIFSINCNPVGMFLCGLETHKLLKHHSEINKFPESKEPCSSNLGLVKKSNCTPYSVTNFLYDLWQMAYFPSWKNSHEHVCKLGLSRGNNTFRQQLLLGFKATDRKGKGGLVQFTGSVSAGLGSQCTENIFQ